MRTIKRGLFAVLLAVACPAAPVAALTAYYVDPDNAGTRNGGVATPWQSLSDSGAWTAINSSLASDDVTVYFSARDAGSDIDETSAIGIHISRTDTSTHVLTLDGMTKYNTNDGSPSWTDYPARTLTATLSDAAVVTGYFYNGSRFYVTNGNPIDTTQVRNSYVTVQGFKTRPTTNQCVWYWVGYHVTVQHNECFRTDAPGVGPGFYFAGMREEVIVDGSGNTCTPASYQSCDGFEYLTIRYNYIHETRGEGIYIGGIGDQDVPGVSAKVQTIEIDHNLIVDPGYQTGEGDGIDIKTMIGISGDKIWVHDNYIRFIVKGVGTPRSCIETMSGIIAERNYCDGGGLINQGISISSFWSFFNDTNRDGSIVRNNAIINIAGIRAGIQCWGDTTDNPIPNTDFTHLVVDNNTVYSSANDYGGIFLGTLCTNGTARNNLVYMNHAGSAGTGVFAAAQFTTALQTHSNNLFYNSSGTVVHHNGTNYTSGTIGSFEASGVSSNPTFVSTSAPYAPANFSIQTTSTAKDAGVTIGTFAVDFLGLPRPAGAAWDIGAYEFGSSAGGTGGSYGRLRRSLPGGQQ